MQKTILSKNMWRGLLILLGFGLMGAGIMLYYHYQILKMEKAADPVPAAVHA